MRWRLLLLLLILAGAAHAEIYKWVDEKGRVRYGEKPPPGVDARRLAPPPAGAATSPSRVDEQEAEFRRRQLERREAEERRAAAERVKARQCESLREELAYTESLQLYRWERGEKVFLSDAEKGAHAQKLRTLIAQHCR